MIFRSVFYLMTLFFATGNCVINEHGYYLGTDHSDQYYFDESLADALIQFFKKENAQSVVDFGCGNGDYVKALQNQHIYCEGYDGNPDTFNISRGVAHVADLSQPFDLNKRFDWVLSLEVGEHLPKKYERIFIGNLDLHNKKGIILSWAIKGQGGVGHFNEQNNDYIKSVMAQYGYVNDIAAELHLRQCASIRWFKNTIMVFRKK